MRAMCQDCAQAQEALRDASASVLLLRAMHRLPEHSSAEATQPLSPCPTLDPVPSLSQLPELSMALASASVPSRALSAASSIDAARLRLRFAGSLLLAGAACISDDTASSRYTTLKALYGALPLSCIFCLRLSCTYSARFIVSVVVPCVFI